MSAWAKGPPPDDLMAWTKSDLARELGRLRAIVREHAEQPGSDPLRGQAPDSVIDVSGDPHARGGALLDARSAVLMEAVEVVLADTKADEPLVMLLRLKGRINYRSERVDHAYLFGPDGAAALVSELVGLATRASAADEQFGVEFRTLLEQRLEALP